MRREQFAYLLPILKADLKDLLGIDRVSVDERRAYATFKRQDWDLTIFLSGTSSGFAVFIMLSARALPARGVYNYDLHADDTFHPARYNGKYVFRTYRDPKHHMRKHVQDDATNERPGLPEWRQAFYQSLQAALGGCGVPTLSRQRGKDPGCRSCIHELTCLI